MNGAYKQIKMKNKVLKLLSLIGRSAAIILRMCWEHFNTKKIKLVKTISSAHTHICNSRKLKSAHQRLMPSKDIQKQMHTTVHLTMLLGPQDAQL